MQLSGWGRYPQVETRVYRPRDADALASLVREQPGLIARGNGRAYGDSAVQPAATVDMRAFNRMLAFDPERGQLVAEAGVLLADIIRSFLPLGWFPRVTPGTKYVTLGGAIAADVHGKNHHKDGSFRHCVDWVELMTADGGIQRCGPDDDPELFDHTLGGMGLTGIVLRAAIRLRPVETAWIHQTTRATNDLAGVMAAFEQASDTTYSVAWIDCLGRGTQLGRSLLMLGEHARLDQLSGSQARNPLQTRSRPSRTLPLDLPAFALNRWSMRAANSLYHWRGRRSQGERLVDWDSYFYPLDALLGWNRIYGRRGFMQFQCVLPLETAETGLTRLLETVADSGPGSFLSVLKRFGPQESAFSFPMEGYTLALDFPVNPATRSLLQRLDTITLEHQGRFYLAKDSRMQASTFHASDTRVPAFQALRRQRQLDSRYRSAQSERLAL